MIHTGALKRTTLLGAGVVPAVLLAALAAPAWAAPPTAGTLDPAFGGDGTVVTDITGDGKSDIINDVAVAPDGKVVAAGYSVIRSLDGEEEDQPDYDFAVARYNPDGSLDATFGTGGAVLTGFGGDQSRDEARAVALQADGKIVVAGNSDPDLESRGGFTLVRYNTDGSLDATFGTGGRVVFDMGRVNELEDMAIQANGRIVVVGNSDARAGAGSDFDFALARFRTDGALDTAFGDGGRVLTPLSTTHSFDFARAVAIQPNGRIVVAGSSNAGGGGTKFAVVRYKRDGSLDGTFGTGGIVLTDSSGAGGGGAASDVAVQADGKIVVAGSGNGFTVLRYRRNGTLDPAFGTGGRTNVALYGWADSVAVQADGRIVLAGVSSVTLGAWTRDFTVARLDRDGSPDASFGDGGKVTTDFGGDGTFDDELNGLAIAPDGGIVAAGTSSSRTNRGSGFAVARYRP